MKTKTNSLLSTKPVGTLIPIGRLTLNVILLTLGVLFFASCKNDTLQLHTQLQAEETIAVGDPILNKEKNIIGVVTAVETDSDDVRTAVLTIDPASVTGKVVRIDGTNPIELASLSAEEGENTAQEDGGLIESKSRTGVVLDQVLPENLTSTKIIYIGAAVCIVLLVLLFVGKALVRAGAALALLALSLLVGWIGTGIATPTVASWLEAHPPAVLLSGEKGNSPLSPWLDWIPENPDPAWVTFLAITCLAYLLLTIVVGVTRRNVSRKSA